MALFMSILFIGIDMVRIILFMVTMAISEVLPFMSTIRLFMGLWMGSFVLMVVASGSFISAADFAPVLTIVFSIARRLTGVNAEGMHISIFGFVNCFILIRQNT